MKRKLCVGLLGLLLSLQWAQGVAAFDFVPGTEINRPSLEEREEKGEYLPTFSSVVFTDGKIQATPNSEARAYVVENVGRNNQPFSKRLPAPTESTSNYVPLSKAYTGVAEEVKPTSPPTSPSKKASSASEGLEERRQFLTVKTKTGKVFYLIINHDSNSEEAQLLTEVSEQDLLNFIVKQGNVQLVESTEKPVATQPVKEEIPAEKEEEKTESSNWGLYLLLLVVGLGAGAGVYYLKFKKPATTAENEEEEDFLEDEED